jgi:hypothetical protein
MMTQIISRPEYQSAEFNKLTLKKEHAGFAWMTALARSDELRFLQASIFVPYLV